MKAIRQFTFQPLYAKAEGEPLTGLHTRCAKPGCHNSAALASRYLRAYPESVQQQAHAPAPPPRHPGPTPSRQSSRRHVRCPTSPAGH